MNSQFLSFSKGEKQGIVLFIAIVLAIALFSRLYNLNLKEDIVLQNTDTILVTYSDKTEQLSDKDSIYKSRFKYSTTERLNIPQKRIDWSVVEKIK